MAYEKVGRVTTESVMKCTGKSWEQWILLLDKAGARGWSHQEIVSYLKSRHKLGPWWQQGVTGGYEIAIGRRVEGQSLKGDFNLTASRSLPITKKRAWDLVLSEDGLGCWLKPLSDFQLKAKAPFEAEGDVFGEVRTFKSGERFRLSWQESDWPKPTIVQMFIIARKGGKCDLGFQHEGIGSARLREALRERWKAALDEIADLARK